jgi:hypothetical protein
MRSITSAACLSAALLLGTTGTAAAQGRSNVETRFGLDLISSGIETVAADSAGVGSRAWGVQVTGNLIAFRVLSLNAEGGVIGMSDEAAFTQETTQGEQTSGVAAGMGTLSAGLRTPPLSLGGERPFHVSAGVNAGRSWVDVNRTITYCVDCHSEDVEVRAGNFVETMLQVGIGRGAMMARYRMYGGNSDFTDALIVGYTITTRRPPPVFEVVTEKSQ